MKKESCCELALCRQISYVCIHIYTFHTSIYLHKCVHKTHTICTQFRAFESYRRIRKPVLSLLYLHIEWSSRSILDLMRHEPQITAYSVCAVNWPQYFCRHMSCQFYNHRDNHSTVHCIWRRNLLHWHRLARQGTNLCMIEKSHQPMPRMIPRLGRCNQSKYLWPLPAIVEICFEWCFGLLNLQWWPDPLPELDSCCVLDPKWHWLDKMWTLLVMRRKQIPVNMRILELRKMCM